MGLLNSGDQLSALAGKPPVVFWPELVQVKVVTGEPNFSVLCRLMCALLALPHSSVCVEQVFSDLNMMEAATTNRLHASAIANRLLA